MKPYDKEDDLSDAGQDLVPKQNNFLSKSINNFTISKQY
jgi:hypothetical protein